MAPAATASAGGALVFALLLVDGCLLLWNACAMDLAHIYANLDLTMRGRSARPSPGSVSIGCCGRRRSLRVPLHNSTRLGGNDLKGAVKSGRLGLSSFDKPNWFARSLTNR